MEKKDLEKAIYMWFNMKYELYEKLEHDGSIYWYYSDQEYADVRINKNNKCIYYTVDFRDEFFGIFPIEISEFKLIIVKWISDTFNLKGFRDPYFSFAHGYKLKIPK